MVSILVRVPHRVQLPVWNGCRLCSLVVWNLDSPNFSRSEKWLQLNSKVLYAAQSDNTDNKRTSKLNVCSITYLEYISTTHKTTSLTATPDRCHQRSLWWSCYFEQIGSYWICHQFDRKDKRSFRYSFPVILEWNHIDLEQLYTTNKSPKGI